MRHLDSVRILAMGLLLGPVGCGVTEANDGPAPVPAGARVAAVSADSDHTCALLDPGGGVRCWGAYFRQPFAQTGVAFARIDTADAAGCGLRLSDHTAACWGILFSGLGDTPPGVAFTDISVGSDNACAIRADNGFVMCWGLNDSGQNDAPPNVAFSSVSAERFNTCGIKTDTREVVCWGSTDSDGPNPVSPTIPFRKISNGAFLHCGIREDNSHLECWDEFRSPGAVWIGEPPLAQPVLDVAAGVNHACALLTDGTAQCWGENDEGECDAPAGVAFTQIAVGAAHTCAIRASDGHLSCWGRNRDGQSTPVTGLE